jgi:hypothetical protein
MFGIMGCFLRTSRWNVTSDTGWTGLGGFDAGAGAGLGAAKAGGGVGSLFCGVGSALVPPNSLVQMLMFRIQFCVVCLARSLVA